MEDVQNSVQWAPDGRALGLELPGSALHSPILLWHEGGGPWVCSLEQTAKQRGVIFDGCLGAFVWSNDRRRVLFRTTASGGFDLDEGTLWCADLKCRRLYLVSDKAVRRMAWADSSTVLYWTVSFPEEMESEHDFEGVESPCPGVARIP